MTLLVRRLNRFALLLILCLPACTAATAPSFVENTGAPVEVKNELIASSAVPDAGSTIRIGSTVSFGGSYTAEPDAQILTALSFVDTGQSFFTLGGQSSTFSERPRGFTMGRTFNESQFRSLFERYDGRVVNWRFTIVSKSGDTLYTVTIPANYTISAN